MLARNTDTRTWRRLIADTIRGAIESQIVATTRALGRAARWPLFAGKMPPHLRSDNDTRNRDVNDPWGALWVTLKVGSRGRSRLGSAP
jgi:hypothetical protein